MNDPEDPGGGHAVAVADEQSVPIDVSKLETVATHVLDKLSLSGELSIALVEPDAIAEMKGRWYGEHAVTDVLSFPMSPPLIGEVIICPAVARRQARGLGIDLDDEMAHLLVHGILHLAGRDHDDARSEIAMAAEERALLDGVFA